MKIGANPTSPSAAADWAAVLALLASPTPKASIDDALHQAAGAATTSKLVLGTSTYPSYYLCIVGDTAVFLVNGCESTGHGISCLTGYTGGINTAEREPTNPYYEAFATAILSDFLNWAGHSFEKYIFAGYSMGGAVAQIMACRAKATSRLAQVTCISFGAPKASNFDALMPLQRCTAARWFSDADAVPLIPPTTRDSISVALLFPFWAVRRFGLFALGAGGLQCTDTGDVREWNWPEQASLSTVSSLGAWLTTADTEGNGPHSLATYASSLRLAARLLGAAGSHAIKPAGPVEPDEDSRKTATGASRMAEQMLAEQERQQHAVSIRIPARYRARVVMEEGIATVYIGDTLLSIHRRRRSAASIARKYNAMTESALRAGVFSKDGFIQSVTDYLNAAEDGEEGIQPALPTTVPGS